MNNHPKKRTGLMIFLAVLLLALVCGLWLMWSRCSSLLQRSTMIDQAFMVKQGSDDTLYIIDSGHERLLHLTKDGRFLWSADMPMGTSGTALYADDIAIAPDGTTYVQVSDWDGMHIDRELILVYGADGQRVDTISDNVYPCGSVNKHSRFGLTVSEKGVSYLQADDDGLTLFHGDAPTAASIPYPDAAVRVSDACIRENDWLVLDKNGTIYTVTPEKREVLYSAAQDTAANRTPYRMTAGADGTIVFTDIRSRSIERVTENPAQTETLLTNTDAQTVSLDRSGQLLLAEPERILFSSSGDELTSWHWSNQAQGLRIGGLVMTIFAGLIVLYFLILGVKLLLRIHLSSTQRTSLLMMVCMVIAVSLVCVKLIDGFRNTYREKIQEELMVIAYMVSSQVNGDDIAQVNTAADFDGEHYQRLVERMHRAFDAEVPLYNQVYCNILRTDNQGNAWAIAYYDQSIGTYFPLEESEAEETLTVVQTRQPTWTESSSLVSGVFCYVKVPVFVSDGSISGVIEVGTETMVLENMISEISRQLLMTLLVLLLIIWLAMGELMSYSGAEASFRERRESSGPKSAILPGHLIRLLVFVMFAAYNLSASFLPVFTMRASAGWDFANPELMASLPITLNIFLIGTMALCCAGLLRKIRIRTLTVFSALFSMAGNLLIYLAPTYPCILLGLALDGIGVGLVSNAVYVLITRIHDEKERLSGLAIYNAACVSGINFGLMLGSLLASNFNQRMVFACAALLWLVVIGVTVAVDKLTGNMLGAEEEVGERGSLRLGGFLRSRGILAFLALVQNPYIIFNSFAYYFVPLFCDELGYSETVVSLLLMVYSLFAVYLSDTITQAVNKRAGRMAMYLALALNICAVVIFGYLQTMPALIGALVLLGLSASFGKSVQQNYFLELPAVKAYGEDRAFGLYNFTENIGESLGPVVFGKLAVFAPRALGFAGFGGIVAACSALHFVISGKRKGMRDQ